VLLPPPAQADFDYYRRMQCAGYRVIAYDKPEPGISVLHERSMTFKTLAQQGAEHRYGWWLTDEVGRYLYFWAKWNTDVRRVPVFVVAELTFFGTHLHLHHVRVSFGCTA
jgi:hypothetical protein